MTLEVDPRPVIPYHADVPEVLRGTLLTASVGCETKRGRIDHVRVDVSRSVSRYGRLSVSFGRDFRSGFCTARVELTLNLPFARASSAVRQRGLGGARFTQRLSGALSYDSEMGRLIPTRQGDYVTGIDFVLRPRGRPAPNSPERRDS